MNDHNKLTSNDIDRCIFAPSLNCSCEYRKMGCKNEQLYTGAANEFFGLLQLIQGNLEKLVVDKDISPRGWERIDSIYGAIRRGKCLVQQLLEIEPKAGNGHDEVDVIGRGETILFVDDDKQVCKLYAGMLKSFGYEVIVAREGKTANEIYCNEQENIAVVILDLRLPDMTGFECMDKILNCAPEARIILATGYPNLFDKNVEHINKAKATLDKPYSITELMTKIRKVLDE